MKEIRIHIIPTANDDGSMSVTETAVHIQDVFKYVNELYKQANVCFIFDPESDFDLIQRSTLLNFDMLKQSQKVIDSWPKNKDYDLSKYSKPLDDEKERVGKEYPGKLVIFVGSGDRYCFDDNKQSPTYNTWKFGPCIDWCPGAFFVRMVNYQPWGKFAHEISHYLQFGDNNTTYQGQVAGYLEPYNTITKEQVETIRKAITIGGKAYHLTQPRVLYDAIWEPSNPGQTRVICWSKDDFAVRFDKEVALNRHIKYMQAYDIGGNQIRWNGVWEVGSRGQTRAICWAQQDFAKRFNDEIAKGKHLVHMQAYDIGDGKIQYDGVWEDGSKGQTWAICWAQQDFAKRFNDEIAKGKHLVHMQAYDIGGNQIRWDGVWEDGSKGQTRAICWAFNDFVTRFNDEIAKGKHLVHMQAYDIGDGKIQYDGVWEDGTIKQTRALA
jgi:hypothetical protein